MNGLFLNEKRKCIEVTNVTRNISYKQYKDTEAILESRCMISV